MSQLHTERLFRFNYEYEIFKNQLILIYGFKIIINYIYNITF